MDLTKSKSGALEGQLLDTEQFRESLFSYWSEIRKDGQTHFMPTNFPV